MKFIHIHIIVPLHERECFYISDLRDLHFMGVFEMSTPTRTQTMNNLGHMLWYASIYDLSNCGIVAPMRLVFPFANYPQGEILREL